MSEAMPKPVVAIVGKPNVGKSALFNRLAGRRIAIVEETPGVTRDRIAADVEVLDHNCLLLDTGGLDPSDKDELIGKVAEHVDVAVDAAAVVLFVINGREDVTATDIEVARRLRKSGKPLLLIANKLDTADAELAEFGELRLGAPLPVSALHARGIHELMGELRQLLPPPNLDKPASEAEEIVKLAIVGRPNVGKSALLNSILGEERAIVSDMPGTTRDSLDTPCTWREHALILIDTAGLRRKARVRKRLEYYSVVRSLAALDRCDAAFLVMDAADGATHQDTKIASYADESGKPTLIVVNKWDLFTERLKEQAPSAGEFRRREKILREDFERLLRLELKQLDYAPIVFTSALDSAGIDGMLKAALFAHAQSGTRLTTGALNRTLRDLVAQNPPPSRGRHPLRIYYATQPSTHPPTFVLFCNDPRRMTQSYQRYIENQFRQRFKLMATPMKLVLRASHKSAA